MKNLLIITILFILIPSVAFADEGINIDLGSFPEKVAHVGDNSQGEWYHFIAGFGLYGLGRMGNMTRDEAIVMTAGIGIGKEIFDVLSGTGEAQFLDFFMDMAGCATHMILEDIGIIKFEDKEVEEATQYFPLIEVRF